MGAGASSRSVRNYSVRYSIRSPTYPRSRAILCGTIWLPTIGFLRPRTKLNEAWTGLDRPPQPSQWHALLVVCHLGHRLRHALSGTAHNKATVPRNDTMEFYPKHLPRPGDTA